MPFILCFILLVKKPFGRMTLHSPFSISMIPHTKWFHLSFIHRSPLRRSLLSPMASTVWTLCGTAPSSALSSGRSSATSLPPPCVAAVLLPTGAACSPALPLRTSGLSHHTSAPLRLLWASTSESSPCSWAAWWSHAVWLLEASSMPLRNRLFKH